MCEICTNLKNEAFQNVIEWDLFDLQLTRFIFKSKIIGIQYDHIKDAYRYQCSTCIKIWLLKEPLFAKFGITGYFIPSQNNSN
jgi:hypothetical protein